MAALESVIAPALLVTFKLPTPDFPAIRLLPIVTVLPRREMSPAVVESGRVIFST